MGIGEQIALSYLRKSDGSLNNRYRIIAQGAVANLPRLSSRDKMALEEAFYESMVQKWLCLATPVLSNSFRDDKYGLPISCYVINPSDSIYSIGKALAECCSLTQYGGGVSIGLDRIRDLGQNFGPPGENWKTNGARSWARLFDVASQEVTQGTNRRGAVVVWINIETENFWQILNSINEVTSGGDPAKFIKCNVGVIVPVGFMEKVRTNDSDAYKRFKALLSSRMAVGHPYIQFQDNMDASMPQEMQAKGLKYGPSNICTEIHSDANDDQTMVCCLSSLNNEFWEDWKYHTWNTDAFGIVDLPGLATIFLEAVLNNFTSAIETGAFHGFERVYNHAISNRAIGIGQLGLAALFMKLQLPYESEDALDLSTTISQTIHIQSNKASAQLAELYGVPENCHEFRHNRRTAIAPTVTNSKIAGTTPNKEPIFKNAFQDGRGKKASIYTNPFLVEYLRTNTNATSEILAEVMKNDGSVQNLSSSLMSDKIKEVFKTSFEMDPLNIAKMDIARVPYLTQGQSNNYNLPHNTSLETLFKLHFALWRGGCSTAYYIRSNSEVKKFALESTPVKIPVPEMVPDCGCDG